VAHQVFLVLAADQELLATAAIQVFLDSLVPPLLAYQVIAAIQAYLELLVILASELQELLDNLVYLHLELLATVDIRA
jgi:hypothetical protein